MKLLLSAGDRLLEPHRVCPPRRGWLLEPRGCGGVLLPVVIFAGAFGSRCLSGSEAVRTANRRSRRLRRPAFWAAAEFAALGRLWQLGAPVPYPVQLHGTELLLEYLEEPDGWEGSVQTRR